MGRITLGQAAAWCGGEVDPKYASISFLGADNDSRIIQPGQLFVALQGARDGSGFIRSAMERGAAGALCAHCEEDLPVIRVEDPRAALGTIARKERERIGMRVVGITGSVGKSTTKEMIACVLARKYKTEKTPANHNNDIGMPMAILAMPEDTQVAVLEMGMNHFREIAYLTSIAQPDVAVITNIGTMHIEHLGSQRGILQAKLEILEGMKPEGILLLNGDDRLLWNLRETGIQADYFGIHNSQCRIRGENVEDTGEKLSFDAAWDTHRISVSMALEGVHFVPDALAAISVGAAMGVEPEDIRQALGSFQNMEGRQEILHVGGYTIIKDCYNAGPESMAAALNVLEKHGGRRVAVLGDMLELGSCTQAEHYRIGRIAAEKADLVLAYGEDSSRVVSGAITGGMPVTRAMGFTDQEELTAQLKKLSRPGDTILFKGSHGMHLERVVERFVRDLT